MMFDWLLSRVQSQIQRNRSKKDLKLEGVVKCGSNKFHDSGSERQLLLYQGRSIATTAINTTTTPTMPRAQKNYVTDSEDEDGNGRATRPPKQNIRIFAHTLDRVYVLMYETHWSLYELRQELMTNPRTVGNVVPRNGEFSFAFGRRQRLKLIPPENESRLFSQGWPRTLAIHVDDPSSMREDPEQESHAIVA
jgi:predicted  nucleic acid-binding Zn-ribbon protein